MTTSGMHRRPFEGRHLVIYVLMTEFIRANFGYLKLKQGMSDDNFGRRDTNEEGDFGGYMEGGST